MTKMLQIYKCEKCGNIVEVLHTGVGQLICCGEPMVLYEENTKDAALEKHVPVVEQVADAVTKSAVESIITGGFGGTKKIAGCYKVTVGSVAHPMTDEHHIEWIELVGDGKAYRKFLKPGEAPEAVFCIDASEITAREYCNLHGLWKKEGQ